MTQIRFAEGALAAVDLTPPTSIPAHIILDRSTTAVKAAQKMIKRLQGTDISDEELFTFGAEVSNQHLDSYFTRMADSSLKNYAADASQGVAFMASHRHNTLPIGYSTRGELVNPDDEESDGDGSGPSVLCDFYTVRGLVTVDGFDIDGFIKSVETALIRDVSIGFKFGENFRYTCNICGLDMMEDWDCRHYPGGKYEVVKNPEAEPDDQIREEVLCFAWVENARLSEVSAVFDGSTPNAMLTKMMREQRAGRLKPEVQHFMERTYRIELPPLQKSWQVPDIPDRGAGDSTTNKEKQAMADNDKSGAPDKLAERERDLDDQAARLEARACGVEVGDTETTKGVIAKLRAEVERLKPYEGQATDAKELRTALVDEALEEGVRAFDKEFDKDKSREMLEAMPINVIRTTRDSWKAIAEKVLPTGRTTGEGEGDKDKDGEDARATDSDDDLDFSDAAGMGATV